MPIHADVVIATNPKPDATLAASGELNEDPAPIDGADGGTEPVPATKTPRSGKKEKKQ